VRLAELQHAAFFARSARPRGVSGPEGEDDFAWTGDTRFDVRCAAAETPGRYGVERVLRREPGETFRFTGLFASISSSRARTA